MTIVFVVFAWLVLSPIVALAVGAFISAGKGPKHRAAKAAANASRLVRAPGVTASRASEPAARTGFDTATGTREEAAA